MRSLGMWEWDGTTWAQIAAPAPFGPRCYHGMSYDPQRQRVILFGGQDSYGTTFSDLWEWDGTTWSLVTTQLPAPARSGTVFAYDPVRRQVVLSGGYDFSETVRNDTWVMSYDSTVPVERCVLSTADDDLDGLAGCADPDCWARCSPACPPGAGCAASAPRCGDGACAAIEDHYICPDDCP